MPNKQNYGNRFFSAKNLIFYLVLAVIVYGLVYFFFMEGSFKNIDYSALSALYKKKAAEPVALPLRSVNNSGESGRAVLTESGGKTVIVLSLAGFKSGVSQPAHIHVGSCPGVGAVKYPLNNLVNGRSVTTLPLTIAKLVAQRPLAINVHKSLDESKVYVSCGSI